MQSTTSASRRFSPRVPRRYAAGGGSLRKPLDDLVGQKSRVIMRIMSVTVTIMLSVIISPSITVTVTMSISVSIITRCPFARRSDKVLEFKFNKFYFRCRIFFLQNNHSFKTNCNYCSLVQTTRSIRQHP